MKMKVEFIFVFCITLIINLAVANKLRTEKLPPLISATNIPNGQGCDKGMFIDPSIPIISSYDKAKIGALPDFFDARQKWGKCIHPVRNQDGCGSCWAFTTTEVISDRICIISDGTHDVILSPQELVSCDTYDSGCKGGYAPTAFKYMTDKGVSTDECTPYKAENGTCNQGQCTNPSETYKAYKCMPDTAKYYNGTDVIKVELMTNGPLYVRFDVFNDFEEYSSGIYGKSSHLFLGGHAVKLIGWGTEDRILYWLIQNSWSETFGEEGYFRIKIGEAGIAIFGYACTPTWDKVDTKEIPKAQIY